MCTLSFLAFEGSVHPGLHDRTSVTAFQHAEQD
ncbi:hypothetical protein HNR42_003379 [Deinobacterium chartae]|uniref:Uncharacterized protein n=1 Tax=Deinobacterium chartae TaxID=521158 RepID=A0A841I6Q1_9DEIO|nr:hypothetical protein [Deinobacterium chartae]